MRKIFRASPRRKSGKRTASPTVSEYQIFFRGKDAAGTVLKGACQSGKDVDILVGGDPGRIEISWGQGDGFRRLSYEGWGNAGELFRFPV